MVYETVRTVLFYLDTRQRSGGTIGSPQFTFPNNLINVKPQNGEKLRLTLQEASIEYTFYQTEEFNNKFVVRETTQGFDFPVDDPDALPIVTRLITIPIGNYNLSTFLVEIVNALNAYTPEQFSAGSPQIAYYQWQLTYIPETNRWRILAEPRAGFTTGFAYFIFDPTLASTFDFPLYTGTDPFLFESLNEMLGFQDNSVVRLVPNLLDTAIECSSQIPVTMSPGVENLYVTVRNSCSNYGNANVSNTFTSSNILGKIPVSNPPFSTLYFYDVNGNFSTIIENKYIDNLSLTLFNEQFTQIEPRKDWTLTVKIEIVRPDTNLSSTSTLHELLELEKMKILRKDRREQVASKAKTKNQKRRAESKAAHTTEPLIDPVTGETIKKGTKIDKNIISTNNI